MVGGREQGCKTNQTGRRQGVGSSSRVVPWLQQEPVERGGKGKGKGKWLVGRRTLGSSRPRMHLGKENGNLRLFHPEGRCSSEKPVQVRKRSSIVENPGSENRGVKEKEKTQAAETHEREEKNWERRSCACLACAVGQQVVGSLRLKLNLSVVCVWCACREEAREERGER